MSVLERWTIWTCSNCGVLRHEMSDDPCGGCAQVAGVRIREVVPASQLQGVVSLLREARGWVDGHSETGWGAAQLVVKIDAAIAAREGR